MTGAHRTWKISALATLAALSAVLLLRAAPVAGATATVSGFNPNDPAQAAEYQHALSLGVRAYVYGIPLLDTDRVFRTGTSVTVPNGEGSAPVNQFGHVRRFTRPSDKTVVAPNRDTLYSIAWLDLRREPIVVHMPVVKHRFVVMELLDPYTTAFAQIGSVGLPAGNYAVVPPSFHGKLPPGVKELRSPYTRVWVIGRTYVVDQADIPSVEKIQNQYTLTPLSKFGTGFKPPRPKHIVRKPTQFVIPGTAAGANPLKFFDALGEALKEFPPPTADRPLLSQLKTVGIGAGLHPSSDTALNAATRQGLHDAVAAGAKQVTTDVQTLFLRDAPKDNGWLVKRTGSYGTDYVGRAEVDQIGLGAPQSSLAIYPFTVTDRDLHPLNGANRYVAHFSKQNLPFPARAFWSMTLYDSHGFFVPNPAGIYLVNNRSHVQFNADGSLDLYIQPHAPSNPTQRRNWLPSPEGKAFRLIIRLYKPINVAGILSGRTWQPPTVLPCLPNGMTRLGTLCAS